MKFLKNLVLICSLSLTSNLVLAKSGEDLYEEAYILFRQDPVKAIEKLKASCNDNYGRACYELARGYSEGKVLPKNSEKAEELFKKACKAKYEEACNITNEENIKMEIIRAVAELAAAKDLIDFALYDNKKPVLDSKAKDEEKEEALGVLTEDGKPRSQLFEKLEFTGDIQNGKNGSIKATIGNKADKSIHGVEVEQYRFSNGVWKCYVSKINNRSLIPIGCQTN